LAKIQDTLIDENGEPLSLATLGRKRPQRGGEAGSIAHALRNRGYIRLGERSDSVRVELCAGAFTPLTLIGALFWLHDRRARRIVLDIRWSDGELSLERFSSIGAFANWVEALPESKPARPLPA
jgi:hypothetical protein